MKNAGILVQMGGNISIFKVLSCGIANPLGSSALTMKVYFPGASLVKYARGIPLM
ncbi:hypothetical protein D3C72_1389850 [compost metagenome]